MIAIITSHWKTSPKAWMTVFIAAPGTETLPVRMFLYIQDNIDPLVTSVSACVIAVTVLALVALVLFGGTAIEGFALVMLFGVIVCTYSAMFVSTPVLLYLDVRSGFSRSESTDEKVAAGAKS